MFMCMKTIAQSAVSHFWSSAKSRVRCSSCNLARMHHTCPGRKGGFGPLDLPQNGYLRPVTTAKFDPTLLDCLVSSAHGVADCIEALLCARLRLHHVELGRSPTEMQRSSSARISNTRRTRRLVRNSR